MGVVESASHLFDLLSEKDNTFTKYLLPGLTREQIDSMILPLGIVLPEEVIEFYTHFDLPKGYQYNEDQPNFFGIDWMLGLEDAVEQYKINCSCILFTDQEKGRFPFLQEDAYYYNFDTANMNGYDCPILDSPEDGESKMAFINLQAMFDTMSCWIEEGVLGIEEGHIASWCNADLKRVVEIANRFNPGNDYWNSIRLEKPRKRWTDLFRFFSR